MSGQPAQPACPSCQAALPQMPQRKTRCKACGQFMYVRSTPDDRTRRLMTEAQMQASEAAWRAHGAAELTHREVQTYGRVAGDYTAPVQPADVADAMRRALVLAEGGQPAKMAVMGLYRAAATPTEALAAHLALGMLGLAQARSIALTAQLVCDPPDPRRPCDICERMRGAVVRTDSTADVAAPLACPRLLEPVGRLRRLCGLSVSAWIKRPDGSSYLDRRPTPERPRKPMTAEEVEQARIAWSRVLGFELPKPNGAVRGSDGDDGR